jgi:hypothetical protein
MRRCLPTQSDVSNSGGHFHLGNVCFWGQSGRRPANVGCLFLTQGGHERFTTSVNPARHHIVVRQIAD